MSGQRGAFALTVLLCALVTGCATDAGATIPCDIPPEAQLVPNPDGGLYVVWPDGTTVALAFANGACVFDSMVLPITRAERTEEQLRFTYDYYRLSLAPCLDALGFRSLAPPSKAVFLASGGNWSPYDAVFSALLSADEIADIGKICPASPPLHGE